jgi:TonB family protein
MKFLSIFIVLQFLMACTSPEAIHNRSNAGPTSAMARNQPAFAEFTQVKVKSKPQFPEYPSEARASGVEGIVVVEITVDVDGTPIKAQAIKGPMELRFASERYCMAWVFEPATLNGKPQIATFKINCPWHLK